MTREGEGFDGEIVSRPQGESRDGVLILANREGHDRAVPTTLTYHSLLLLPTSPLNLTLFAVKNPL